MAQKGLPNSYGLAIQEAENTTYDIPKDLKDEILRQEREARQRQKEIESPVIAPEIPQFNVNGQGGRWDSKIGKTLGFIEQNKNAFAGFSPSQMNWVAAIAAQESAGNPNAVSPVGAQGFMQIMPATGRDPGYGIAPMRDSSVRENVRLGLGKFEAMMKRYNGDVDKALAAYNAGEGNVDKALKRASQYGGNWMNYLPRPAETIPYVRNVKSYYATVTGGQQQNATQPTQQPQRQAQPQHQTTQQNSRYQPITGDALKRLKEAEARGDDEFVPFIGAKPIKIPVTPQKQKEIDNSGILKQFGYALGSGYDNTLRHVGNASWMLTGNDTDTVVDNVYQGYLQNQKAQRNRTSGQKRLDAAIEQVGEGDGFLDTLSKGWNAVKVAVQEPRATLLGAAESTATMIPTFVGGTAGAGTGAGVGAAGGAVTGSAAGGVGALPGAAAGAVGGAIWGGRIGMIAGTTATEAGAELEHMIFERLKKQNKPVTKENIKTLLNDPKFRSEAQAQGSAKGLTLAMVDQLTMGLSGRVLSAPAKNAEKKAIKIIIDGTNVDEKAARALLAAPAGRAILARQSPSTLRKAVAATGAFGIELMGEPAGEAISQAFARGEVNWSDVTGEFIYGAGNAAAGTVVSGTINAGQAVQQRIRNGGLSTQADTTTTAQQEQPQEQTQAAPQARTQSPIPQAPEVDPLTPANTPAQPERKIGAIERAIGSDNLDQTINAEIEAVNAEQWLGEPGQVVNVSPKQDPNSTYTVTIESYENGEVFARDQDNTPIQFGREDIISATPVQQDNQAAAQGNQPDAAVVDGEVATLDDAAPELLDFGYAAREQSAVTQQDANLSDFETATPQAAPKAEPTPKTEIEDAGKTLAKMNEAELRARIKYLADQAKATGGWNKMLMDERRKVESEINKRNKPVIDDKPYFKWEGMSPAERMAMAEKKGIDPATAKDISTKAWGAIDQSITTKLTAKAAPKKAAQAKAPKIEQPKAEQAKQADFADAVPEAPKATAEAAPFRELIIDAHFNNPRAKAQLIADEVKAGRPRHEVLKQVQGIVSEINAGKIAAPTAAATQVTATQAESTVTKTETATPKAQDQNVSKKTDKIDTTEKRVDTNDKKGEKVERVTTPAGREFEVRHKLVDVSDLIVSNTGTGAINPNYPQQLQPRDRTRLASQNQINEIASKLNPRLLGESVNAAEGAPIVSNDNVVESGNGRTLAIRQAYERGLANDYRQWLEDQGYDTEGMAMPMLVRERVTPMTWDERTAYTKEANERTTLELSPAERATMDAQKIGPILYQFKGGEIDTSANRPFVRAFIDEIVSPSDRGGMLEGGGQLSQAGKRRIQAALVAKAYGDETLITDMFESVDSDIKAIGGALMDVSGEWASMRDGVQNGTISGSVDVTPNLMEAVNIIRRARAEGRTVFELVNQDDIFAGETDPVTRGFVSVFYRGENLTRARGRDKVAGALRHYAQQALATQPGENMFGDPEIKGSEILRNTNERLQNQEADKQQDLLSSTPVNEQNTGMVGERGQRSVVEAQSQVAAEAAEVTPNPADKFKQFNDVAKQYGRTVNENGEIISQKGKPTGVFVTEKNGRVRIEQNGKLLFSGANAQSLGKFLEDYWYDTKVKATTEASKHAAERPAMPKEVNAGPFVLKPKPIGKSLYREMDGTGLDNLVRGTLTNGGGVTAKLFVTDNIDLALGQGTNKGVLVQLRGDAVSGTEHKKPVSGDLTGREYQTDFISIDAIDQILVPKNTRVKAMTRQLINRNFDRKNLDDGMILYTRKGVDVGQPLNEMRSEETAPLADGKTKHEMTIEGRRKDGGPIMPGHQFVTSSGRLTTPYPKQKSERYASQWLIDNAVDEAKSRGDRFNSTIFASYKPLKDGTLSTADREGMLMYLYGEQPAVVRSIFKDDDGIRYSRVDNEPAEVKAVREQYQGTDQWMKAPNGKATNLNEQQWLQVRTPSFKNWFGDWENDAANASKVVDDNGEPMVVYHGTGEDGSFTIFDESRFGNTDKGYQGEGFYFSESKKYAQSYAWKKGSELKSVFINARNPFKRPDTVSHGENWREATWEAFEKYGINKETSPEQQSQKLKNQGFDGIYVKKSDAYWSNDGSDKPFIMELVVYSHNQIKSATDNVGTFDASNPDIRFSRNSALAKLRDIYGYRDSHLAPDADGGFNSHQLANVYPDLNSRNFAREYGDGRPYDAKTVKIMREMQKNPEGEITVYRAVPAGIEANTLNYGDWVAITKDYAIEHGNSRFDGKYKIIEQKVKGSDLYTDGNSIDEWGYSPQGHEVEVAKTRLKEQLERLNNALDQGPYRSRISMADVLQNHNELRHKPSLAKAFLDSIGEKIEPIYEKDSLSNELKALSDQVKASDSKYDLIDNRPELIDQIFDLVEVAKYREQLNSPLSRVRTRAQTMIDAMQNFSAEQKGRIVSSVLDEMRAYDAKNTERKINETATARNAVELAQAKGEQFDQFIDSRLRSMDNDAETILNSRAANVSTAQLSPSMVRGALVKRFGDAAIAKLERDGVLSIVESFDVSGVEGYAVNGKVTLVADALNPQTIIPTFLHELGGHVGFQGVMNPNAYQNLMDQFNKLVKANDPIALEAKRLAEREINPEIQKDEYLPYLITIAASKQQQRPGVKTLINRIVAAVKAWAFDRLGLSINLNANDVLALAERMVDKVAYQQKYMPAEQRYSYAGKKAWYSDLDKLDQARSMKENGISDGAIRNATGWFTGQDGNWRFEIDDSRSQVKNLDRLSKDTYTRLEEIYEHDELFRNYPVLQDYAVRLVDSDNRYDGILHVNRKTISINERHIDNAKYVREILAHELQHAIQGIEDFAQGGSINEQFAASVKNNLQTLKQTKQWELDDRLSESAWAYSERDRLRKELRNVSLFETVKNLRKYANMDKPSSQLRHMRNNFNIIVHLDHLATMGEIESTQEQRYALRDIQRDWYAVGKRTQKQFNPRLKDISWRAADLIQQFIDPRVYQELNVSEASTKSIKGKLERRINKLYQEIAPTEAVKREVADFGSKVDRLMNASPSTIYMALAGEIEARDVEARIDMTPEERQRTLPYSSQDEYNDRAIVVRDNRLQAMSVKPENVGEYSNLSASDLVQKLQSEHDGLKLSIFGNGQNVTLSKIIIPDGSRGAGIGSQVMNKITEWADQNQKTIALTPSADFGGNKKRLGEFYKRFGFVENKGRNKDFEISESMYRSPIEINNSKSDVTSNPDIRFSRVDTEANTNADQKPSFYKELKKLPTDALTAFMNNGGLAATPLRPMLTELASDIPSAKTYLRTKEKMDTVRNDWHARTDTVAQNWLKYRIKNREENKALMNIMHDSTLEQVDPSKPFQPLMTPQDNEALNNLDPKHPNYKNLVEKQERDVRRQDAHARLKQEFDALSPKAKEIYASVRDTYTDMADEFDRVLLANMEKAINIRAEQAEMDHARELRRIKDEGLTGDEKTKAIEEADKKLNNAKTKLSWNRKARMTQMRKQFESNRLVGPYFPLARYGDYFVTVRDAESGEVLSFQRFESVRQQRKFAEEMGADKDVKVETGMLSDAAQARKAVDANFVADVEDILADLPNADSVKDQVWQRYLESLPEMSIRKARIHRKNRAGFNTDAVRAFGHHMFHGSHQLARMTYSMDLEQALNRAEVEVRESKDPVRNGAILNEMNKAHQFVMNPTGSSWAQAISSISFVWFLAGSPKAALANLFQTPIMGVGILAAFDGAKLNSVARVSNQLLKAYADFGRGLGDIKQSSKLTADERNAVEQAYEIGIIDKTQGHDLAGVAETGIQYNAAREKAMRVISWGFHHTERLNREVTFLAAYRIARDKGLAHEDAITKAGDLTWDTHYDYSNTSRPRFMRNDFAKALLVFRNYQVNMLFRLFRDTHQAFKADTPQARREAFTRLAGITGMMMLNAGITGTWMYGIAMVMAGLFMGEGEDPDEELKKAIVNTLGPELGGMALYGIPGHVTGTSLSASVGMADLWFRSPESDYDKRDAESLMTYYVFQTLGASFSIPLQFAQGIDKIKKGETYRGIENMVPKMIKDPMKAYRYAREDVLNMRGDKVADADFDDVVKQALGFTPARIAEQYNINTKSYNKESLITGRRSELLNDYYKAWRKDDTEAMDVIQEDIVAFNEKYPEKAIMPRNIIQSIKSKEKTAAEAVNGARYDRKLKDRIVEDQAPAIYK